MAGHLVQGTTWSRVTYVLFVVWKNGNRAGARKLIARC